VVSGEFQAGAGSAAGRAVSTADATRWTIVELRLVRSFTAVADGLDSVSRYKSSRS
jgi:hypothetical protein